MSPSTLKVDNFLINFASKSKAMKGKVVTFEKKFSTIYQASPLELI
jgi:hypothetical protein